MRESMPVCPICRTKTKTSDIRPIHATQLYALDNTELTELKEQNIQLEKLGIKYTECLICNTPFSNEKDRSVHMKKNHEIYDCK